MRYIRDPISLHISYLSFVNFGTINMNRKEHIVHLVLEKAKERRLFLEA